MSKKLDKLEKKLKKLRQRDAALARQTAELRTPRERADLLYKREASAWREPDRVRSPNQIHSVAIPEVIDPVEQRVLRSQFLEGRRPREVMFGGLGPCRGIIQRGERW